MTQIMPTTFHGLQLVPAEWMTDHAPFNDTHPIIGEWCSCFSLTFAGWVLQGAGQCLNPKQSGGASDFFRGIGRKRLAQMLEKEK